MKRIASITTRRRGPWIPVVASIAAIAVLSCGACGPTGDDTPPLDLPSKEGKQYARALCQAVDSCGCALPSDSRADCEEKYLTRFDTLLEAGLTVDNECFAAWLEDIEADPCRERVGDDDPPGSPWPCSSLRGNKGMGASCVWPPGMGPLPVDECRDGSTCRNAQCVETPSTNQVGWKELEAGQPCGPTYDGFCRRDTLFCNPANEVCEPRVSAGSECFDRGCERCSEPGDAALYCEGASLTTSGTCAPLPRVGEACDPADTSGCGACGEIGWCEPASATCVLDLGPSLCRSVHE